MPYKSEKQRKWAHTKEGINKLGKKIVEEFDNKSKNLKASKSKRKGK